MIFSKQKYVAINITTSLLLLLFAYAPVSAQLVRDSVEELSRIDIVERLGENIPLNLKFTNQNGQAVTLGDYFKKDKPVILVLAYYECPMLCNLVLNGLGQGIKDLSWTPGEKYEIITVSIDPLETAELAFSKRANYLKSINRPDLEKGWDFLVGDDSQSKALTEAVGFKYYYIEDKDEYAHPAAIYILSDEGKISRYLYGIEFKAKNLKLGLLEAAQGKIGSSMDRIILYCFRYNPDEKGYVLIASNVMKLAGAITLILLSTLVGVLWYREKRKVKVKVDNIKQNLPIVKE